MRRYCAHVSMSHLGYSGHAHVMHMLLFFSKLFRDGFLPIKNSLSRSELQNLET